MSIINSHRLRDALSRPPIGSKPTMPTGRPPDLEELLRKSQDRLRGRPQTAFERAWERWSPSFHVDWEAIAFGVILSSCAAIIAALAVVLWVGIVKGFS